MGHLFAFLLFVNVFFMNSEHRGKVIILWKVAIRILYSEYWKREVLCTVHVSLPLWEATHGPCESLHFI